MKKILMSVIAAVTGLLGLGNARAENPHYDPDSQVSYPVSNIADWQPGDEEVRLTDTWNPDA